MKDARRGVPLRKLSYCDLPDWFDLSRYSPTRDFDLRDWLREFYKRTVFVHQTETALKLFGRYWEMDVEETLADRLVASNSPKSTKGFSGKIDEVTDRFFTHTVNPITLHFLAWIMMEVSRNSTQLTNRIKKSIEALDAEDWSDELDAFLSKAVDDQQLDAVSVANEMDYPLAHAEINLAAVSLARQVANDFSTPEKPRFIAGSMGPTTKLPSLGHIGFDDMAEAYQEQAAALI